MNFWIWFNDRHQSNDCFLIFVKFVAGVLDKIKTGFEYASNYLETAKDIADLVANSLGSKQKEKRGEDEDAKNKGSFGPSTVMSAFFRLFGLDSQKVTAIAVNSVIFLAQMVLACYTYLYTSLSYNIE